MVKKVVYNLRLSVKALKTCLQLIKVLNTCIFVWLCRTICDHCDWLKSLDFSLQVSRI